MKHKLWGGLTAVILLPVLSLTSSGHAESISASNPTSNLSEGKSLTASESTDVIKVGEYQSQQANAA
ncbi:MAG TPA: hypothetical protein V6D21_02550, partial [Candidatus Obscuribacterales bacterium]